MKKINYRRIGFGCILFLLIALACAQILPIFFNEPDLINQTALQSTRVQRITKDALILAYRSSSEHSQAISEMQDTLPALETEQVNLRTLTSSDTQLLVTQSQPDYAAIDTATRVLLAHPTGTIDFTQVEIIAKHERNYSLIMSQLAALRESKIQSSNLDFVVSQSVISVLIIVLVILSMPSTKSRKEML